MVTAGESGATAVTATGVSVGQLYEAAVDDGAWAALPALAAEAVGARSSVIHQFDERRHLIDCRYSYLTDTLMADLLVVHPDGRDIWADAGLRNGVVDKAVSTDTLIPEAAFLRSPLWNDVLRPHGSDTGRSMGIMHRLDGGTLLVSFQRALRQGAFGPADLARFDAIATDLHRIHRVRRLLGAAAGRARRLEALLTGERACALLVGPGLRLLEASPAARALLRRADGLALRDGCVRPTDPGLIEPLRQAADTTIRRAEGTRATHGCPRPGAATPWTVLVLPAPDAGEPACMLLIRGGEQPGDRRRLWLAQQHGATAAEIAVAEALLAGDTPEEIAAERGVSLHTVRTQVRRLLDKAGVRRVGELLVLLARLG